MLRCLHCDRELDEASIVGLCGAGCFHLLGVRYQIRSVAARQGLIPTDEIFKKNPNFRGRKYIGPRAEFLWEN